MIQETEARSPGIRSKRQCSQHLLAKEEMAKEEREEVIQVASGSCR